MILWRLNFPCRRFGTICVFQLRRCFEQTKGKNVTFKTRRNIWHGDGVVVLAATFVAAVSGIVSIVDDVFVLMIQVLWDIILCLWVSSSDVSEDRNALLFIINPSALRSYIHGLIHPDIEGETIVRNYSEYLTTHCNILEDSNFLYYCCDYPNLMSLLFLLFFWLTFHLTVRWASPIAYKKEAEERVLSSCFWGVLARKLNNRI